MLLDQVFIDSNTGVDIPAWKALVAPEICPRIITPTTEYYYTPSAFFAQMFKQWHGGMKFFFQFIGSPFVTTRVRISHFPSTVIPSSIEDYAGDIVSSIVDVRGDTVFPLTVPYMNPFPYTNTNGIYNPSDEVQTIPTKDQNSLLVLSLVNPLIQPTAGVGCIHVNIWVAAAEDLVFVGPLSFDPRTPAGAIEPDELETQSMVAEFSKPFPTLAPGIGTMEGGFVAPEHASTVKQLAMRMQQTADVPADSLLYVGLDFWGTKDFAAAIMQMFRWYRGGLRFKILPVSTGGSLLDSQFYRVGLSSDYDISAGGNLTHNFGPQAGTRPDLNPIIDVEIPWMMNTYAYGYYDSDVPTDNNEDGIYLMCTQETSSKPWIPLMMWRGVADDFLYGHPLAPPIVPYTPPSLSATIASVKNGKPSLPVKGKEKESASDLAAVRSFKKSNLL
jgi:hypothetical protein